MRFRRALLATASVAVVTMASAACIEGDKSSDEVRLPVNHSKVQQAITANTTDIAKQVAEALKFLENSDLFQQGFGMALGGMGSGYCTSSPRPAEPPVIETSEGDGEPRDGDDYYHDDYYDYDYDYDYDCVDSDVEFKADFTEGAEELAEFLSDYVFVTGNVELESGNSVTYLLNGETVCPVLVSSDSDYADYHEGDEEAECEEFFTKVEVRLLVTSPAEGDVKVAVLLGAQKLNPLTLEFYSNQLAADLSLSEVKSSILLIASSLNEQPPSMPDTMLGRIRAALQTEGDTKVTATLSVLEDIVIADEDAQFSLAKAAPAVEVKVDSAAETLAALLDLGPLDALFTVGGDSGFGGYADYDDAPDAMPHSEEGDDGTDWEVDHDDDYEYEPQEPFTVAIQLGGLSVSSVFEVGQELLKLTNVGLGNKTSVLRINNEKVVEIDLNADSGRTFDVEVQNTDDGVELTFSPELDLKVVWQLIKVKDALQEIPSWVLDDVWSFNLSGAAKPKVHVHDNMLEVIDGQLTLSSQSESITHTVDAGMCLAGPEDSDSSYDREGDPAVPPTEGEGDDEPGNTGVEDDYEYDDDYEEQHIFAAFEVTTCE